MQMTIDDSLSSYDGVSMVSPGPGADCTACTGRWCRGSRWRGVAGDRRHLRTERTQDRLRNLPGTL